MKYDLSITLDLPYEAVDAVRAALKEQGFGVLTEIDVQATMREKLEVEMEPYVIAGFGGGQQLTQRHQIRAEVGHRRLRRLGHQPLRPAPTRPAFANPQQREDGPAVRAR